MKKLSRILLMFLVVVFTAASLSACSSGNTAETVTTSTEEITEDPINGVDVFSFLDRYYWSVRMIRSVFDMDIFPDYDTSLIGSPLLDALTDDVRYFVMLPCGDAKIRKSSLELEEIDVAFSEISASPEENAFHIMTAFAVFQTLEGEDIKNSFDPALTLFQKHVMSIDIAETVEALKDGGSILLYEGNYDYTMHYREYGEKPHKELYLKITAN